MILEDLRNYATIIAALVALLVFLVNVRSQARNRKIENLARFNEVHQRLFATGSYLANNLKAIETGAAKRDLTNPHADAQFHLMLLEIERLAMERTDIPPGVFNVVTASDHLVGEELTLSPKGERAGVSLFHGSIRDPIWEYVLTADVAAFTHRVRTRVRDADGEHDLLDMAERSGMTFRALRRAADALLEHGRVPRQLDVDASARGVLQVEAHAARIGREEDAAGGIIVELHDVLGPALLALVQRLVERIGGIGDLLHRGG